MQTFQLDLEKLSEPNGKLVVRLKGKLSLETVHYFLQTMRTETTRHLVLDMGEVPFMDSAGVGALVSLFVSRRNSGRTFALAALTGQGTAILQVAGLAKLLPNFPTVEDALAA
jgi:anti-sigma B factor antagonist